MVKYYQTESYDSTGKLIIHKHLVSVNAAIEHDDFYVLIDSDGKTNVLKQVGFQLPQPENAYKIIASTDNSLNLTKLSNEGVIMTETNLKRSYDKMVMQIQVLEEKLTNREEVIQKLLEIFENTTHQPLVNSILKQLEDY